MCTDLTGLMGERLLRKLKTGDSCTVEKEKQIKINSRTTYMKIFRKTHRSRAKNSYTIRIIESPNQ